MNVQKQDGSAGARAQSGFAIASGITTLVVAAGFFTGIGDKAHAARYLAAGALAAWLLTMFLFLRAETGRERTTATGLRSPMVQAVVAAAVATAFTIAAFVVITATGLSVDVDGGIMQLNGKGQASVRLFCHSPRRRLVPGVVEVPSLEKDFVVFTIDKGWCFHDSSATLKLPRSDVLAFLEDFQGELDKSTDRIGRR